MKQTLKPLLVALAVALLTLGAFAMTHQVSLAQTQPTLIAGTGGLGSGGGEM